MKSFIALTAATGLITSPVMAGPYANIENNTKYSGDTYGGTETEVHAGYDFGDWYVQGGPVFINPRGEAGTAEYSVKVGGSKELSEELTAYGEVTAVTEDKFNDGVDFGTKVGVTYNF